MTDTVNMSHFHLAQLVVVEKIAYKIAEEAKVKRERKGKE